MWTERNNMICTQISKEMEAQILCGRLFKFRVH